MHDDVPDAMRAIPQSRESSRGVASSRVRRPYSETFQQNFRAEFIRRALVLACPINLGPGVFFSGGSRLQRNLNRATQRHAVVDGSRASA